MCSQCGGNNINNKEAPNNIVTIQDVISIKSYLQKLRRILHDHEVLKIYWNFCIKKWSLNFSAQKKLELTFLLGFSCKITDLNLAVNAHIFALLRFPNFRFFALENIHCLENRVQKIIFQREKKKSKVFWHFLTTSKWPSIFYFLKDDATPMIISEEQLLKSPPNNPMINTTTILVKWFVLFFGKFTHLETNSWQPYVIFASPQQRRSFLRYLFSFTSVASSFLKEIFNWLKKKRKCKKNQGKSINKF